jgi:hypothetical protein
MASLTIEMVDGPRKGDSITLKNAWEYPEVHLAPYKDEHGNMQIAEYRAVRLPKNPLKKEAAKIVYKQVKGT